MSNKVVAGIINNKIINTDCINNGKSFDCYKVTKLAGNRREFVFLHRRELKVGTVVSIVANFHKIHEPIIHAVTGTKDRPDGLWHIYVMVKGKA